MITVFERYKINITLKLCVGKYKTKHHREAFWLLIGFECHLNSARLLFRPVFVCF